MSVWWYDGSSGILKFNFNLYLLLKDEIYSSSKFKHCQSLLLTSPIVMFFLMGVSAPHASMSALLTGNRRGGDNTRLICLLFGGVAVVIGREDNKA